MCSRMDLFVKSQVKNSFLWLLYACFFIWKTSAADDPYWFHLSLNQTVTQSSTDVNGNAKKAVDGKVNTCSRTKDKPNPFLMIDFGREIYPAHWRVVVDVNVRSGYPDVRFRVGNNADCVSNDVARSANYIAKWSTSNNYNVKRGRYLCIQVLKKVVLAICELFVFRIPVDSIGYRKPARASSRASSMSKKKVTDGILSAASNTHNMANPWIRLDLLDTYFIREVIIIAASNKAIDDFAIRIGSSLVDEGRANPSCAERQNLDINGGRSFFCRMIGRYIVITKDTVGTETYQLFLSELYVNPSHQENLVEGKEHMTAPASVGLTSFTSRLRLTSADFAAGYVTKVGVNGNWLRLDIGESLPVARIFMVNVRQIDRYMDQMVDFEIRVGDSMEDEGNSNPLCLDGLQSMLGKETASFYCQPRLTGQYVNVNQKTVDKHLALLEIAVYSEAPPEMKDREKARSIWAKVGGNVDLTCEAYGYPTPVVSWVKDDVILNTGSSTFHITSASLNDSGTYECWANNTHGENYKQIEVSITSEFRPCVESAEISYDLGAKVALNQEFLGSKWYRFYDPTARKYLQMSDKVLMNSICSGWVEGGAHPGDNDGVVETSVCVKESNEDCNRQFNVRIRSCATFYVYNLLSSNDTKGFSYCFKTATPQTNHNPAVSSMTRGNNALSNHVLHVEAKINDPSQCLFMCSLTTLCQSFNFSHKEKVCELNSSTKDKHPADLLPRNDFHYYMRGKGLLSRHLGDL